MMTLEQLIGRHLRLREELAAAASSVPWNSGHVDRITQELAKVERDLAALNAPADPAPTPPPRRVANNNE